MRMGWKALSVWMKGGAIGTITGFLIWFIYFQAFVIRESLKETCLPIAEGCAPFLIV